MSQDFDLKFDEFRENDPGKPQDKDNSSEYPYSPYARNLGFAWPDGKMLFLNYSYLVSGEYRPSDSQIILSFTTHEVTLKGVQLESLYQSLMAHRPRFVVCVQERYNEVDDNKQPVVNNITVIER